MQMTGPVMDTVDGETPYSQCTEPIAIVGMGTRLTDPAVFLYSNIYQQAVDGREVSLTHQNYGNY